MVFTAGAAIPALGAMISTVTGLSAATIAGGVGGVVSSAAASLGLDGTLGAVLTGAVTSAADGAAVGAAGAAVTGGKIGAGAEMGALGGALTGGIGGAIAGDPLAAVAVTPESSSASSALADAGYTPSVASSGVAGAAGDAATSLPAAVQPVTQTPLPDITANGAASNGAGGLANQASSTYDGSYTNNILGQTPAAPAATPSVASYGAAGAVPAPASVTTPVTPAAPTSTMSDVTGALFGKTGVLGNGGLGSVISGVGQGLGTADAASTQAKAAATAAQVARNATAANYGQTTDANGNVTGPSAGGLLTQAPAPTGLQTPQQAFNPSARWVYSSTANKLVLVPATGATPTS